MADLSWPSLWPKKKSLVAASFIIMWLQIQVVLGNPRFTKEPPSLQYILRAQNASFHWGYDAGSASLLFGKWKKEGSIVNCIYQDQNGKVVYSKNTECQNFALQGVATLLLTNVSKPMDGAYTCTLDFNDASELSSRGSVKVVNKAPIFTASPAISIVTEGDSFATLTVEAAGDYEVSVTWYKDNAILNGSLFIPSSRQLGTNANSDTMVQSNLTIASPRRKMNNYVFVAKAAYGSHSPTSMSNISLIVWYGPENLRISSAKSKTGVILGQSVEISCTASSNPPPKFTIFHNGSSILVNASTGVLTIASFQRNSSGNYSCMAKNEVGNLTVHGLRLFYIEPVVTTTTAKPTSRTSNGTRKASDMTTKSTNSNPTPGGRTGTASSDLPWWIWLIVGLTILLVIVIAIVAFRTIRRYKSKQKGKNNAPLHFSKKGFDIDTYIVNTNYSLGYENKVGSHDVDAEKGADKNDSFQKPVPEEAREKLGMKFESEHDLIEHYRRRPEEYDDVDFKDCDPFGDDDTDSVRFADPYASDYKDPLSFHNEALEPDDIDDMVKVRTNSDKESEKDSELFKDLGEDIIQYDI